MRHCQRAAMGGANEFAIVARPSRKMRTRTQWPALHSVALEHLAARLRQLGAVAHQARLHGAVIAEVLAAELRRIPRARALLLRRSHMALCESGGGDGGQRDRCDKEGCTTHHWVQSC